MRRPRSEKRPTVLGGSRMGVVELVDAAVNGMFAKPVRSALTTLGTVLGIGSLVVTLGISRTAGAQIVERFDALAATTVTVEPAQRPGSGGGAAARSRIVLPWDVEDRLLPLNGVVAAGAFGDANTGAARISTNAINDPTNRAQLKLRVAGASSGLFSAIRTEPVSGRFFDDGHDARADRVAVIGTGIAGQLGIRDLSRRPVIFIGEEAFTVIGIMADPQREPSLGNAIIIPGGTAAARFGLDGPTKVVIDTAIGAARLIAEQAPLALRPAEPTAVRASSPPEPQGTKDAVSDDVNGIFVVLGLVSLIVGAIGIMNVTLVTVMERTGEIGLRRALGARRRHIAGQFLAESTTLGLTGGIAGATVGIVVIVAVSAARDWTPVLDLRLAALAPLGGAITGLVAGLYPAWRAASMEPVDALRSGT
jgi:putative ABC transport system permease protein